MNANELEPKRATRPRERVLAACGQLSLGQAALAFVPADDVPQAACCVRYPRF